MRPRSPLAGGRKPGSAGRGEGNLADPRDSALLTPDSSLLREAASRDKRGGGVSLLADTELAPVAFKKVSGLS